MIHFIISACQIYRDDDKDDEEVHLMKDIKTCAKSFGKCTVEQTATLRAWSEKNDLPVEKHRVQVMKELDDQDD